MDVQKISTNQDEISLPGFRFHPTDEELVSFYLRRKVERKPFSVDLIKQIDIYKYDPWDLPKMSSAGEKECYFFCKRGRKYRNSIRPNRVTEGSGFWKATGIDRPVYSTNSQGKHECIGLKKSLVYYLGSAGKGTKTDWMMHEFRLPTTGVKSSINNLTSTSKSMQEAETWTICRIFKRNVSYKRFAKELSESSINGHPTDCRPVTMCAQSDAKDHSNAHGLFCHTERKPLMTNQVEGRKQAFFSDQAPLTASNPSFQINPPAELARDNVWDDIRSFLTCQALDYERL